MEMREIGSSIKSSFRSTLSVNSSDELGSFREENRRNEDEVELQWAAIERLPTFERLRTSLFDNRDLNDSELEEGKSVIDVTKLGGLERHVFVEKLVKDIEEDNRRLLLKLKERIDRVGVKLPSVEVRYRNLSIEAECEVVQGKPLPTLPTALKSFFCGITQIACCKARSNKLEIIKDVSGIIKPSRMTLLLGPPGCGKTTLLQAFAGTLNSSLKASGDIDYNGFKFNEFVPQKTSAYISQFDLHISEMTVRETLDFSARCQGIGGRADILKEVIRREKRDGIFPEPDVDAYMKAISIEGLKRTLQTDYMKILGLDICADTIVGDAMKRGISGGQKKRLTAGEMIIGPTKALFMDEISNGLDSSTTFQIVTCLQQLAHIAGSTILVSLLQPAPETFDLFDDVILMSEGKVAYHGPRENVLEFFEQCGFRCPPRKGIADFLQEVVSKKDQEKYWHGKDEPHSYVSVDEFRDMFGDFHVGKKLEEELSKPFEKSECHRDALAFSVYSLRKWELLKACTAREWLLMKRNSFVYVFTSAQLAVVAVITMTVFLRTRMSNDVVGANYYMGSLFYALVRLMSNGSAELALTVSRLSVFYKQKDFYFYPSWTYSIPVTIVKIPLSLLESFLWTTLTYYVIGYSPEPERFLKQLFLLFLVHQVAISMFRLIASVVRNPSVAVNCSLFILVVLFLFSGFVIPEPSLPPWIQWGFWLSPLAYAEIGISVNEFNAPRWRQKVSSSNVTVGQQVLKNRALDFGDHFYWISIAALLGFWILFNIGFTCALSYLQAPGRSRAIISHKKLSTLKGSERTKSLNNDEEKTCFSTAVAVEETREKRVILPFEPVAISFENVQYFVDTPKKLRERGFQQKKLQLLQDITGSFRPGVLTALMGVSGAGKTTLMDVLSGRKTGGVIKGDIRIGGYPKVQQTYARISGYCEQTDVHSPLITVGESVAYSAWLRLPHQIDKQTRTDFVEEVLQMIELDEIRDEIVGVPSGIGGVGLSNEQRKRLTIAVELVSNPSIIFMDEPTTGLDARAAAIVMRVVKNIVSTHRTIVCTIHQPSIDIFDAFDGLILMKRGGQIIYSGELGLNSSKLIDYFEAIPGVPEIKENYNPATWMLEVTSPTVESELGVDFSLLYKNSHQYQKSQDLVAELTSPPQGSKEIKFSTRFPRNGWEQFKACLWRHHLSYWRNPKYNLGRFTFIVVCSFLFSVLLWKKGQTTDGVEDFVNVLGGIYVLMLFMGIGNCSSVMPLVHLERAIVYRERFSGMYSSWAYSFSQVTIEIPYVLVQAAIYSVITYPAMSFKWSAYKACWYFYSMFCSMLYFNFFGLFLTSVTPTFEVASVLVGFSYTTMNLFAGYLIPGPKIPKWWVWAYWTCPTSWSLKGLLIPQYGDLDKKIVAYGEHKTVKAFLEDYYGYRYDDLVIVAIMLMAFPLAFACAFGFANAKLNFQKR